ncbi:class F sortase [Bacillus cereus]|uniref:class F sortase n=1 Tax=Bacillus cereus TaxID=1396 RepID=UPI00397F430D
MFLVFSSVLLFISGYFFFTYFQERKQGEPSTTSVSFSPTNTVHQQQENPTEHTPTKKNHPTHISFPIKQANAPIFEVGVDDDGRMQTIADANSIAWYGKGAAPGETGNTILAGHRDWKGDIGIFQYLEDIQLEEPVAITLEDGTTKTYLVAEKQSFYEEDVPSYVMSQEGENRITLITCTGQFDKAKRSYVKRLIVTLK